LNELLANIEYINRTLAVFKSCRQALALDKFFERTAESNKKVLNSKSFEKLELESFKNLAALEKFFKIRLALQNTISTSLFPSNR
jgi:hypothetical protein